jgi:hypothetical protein
MTRSSWLLLAGYALPVVLLALAAIPPTPPRSEDESDPPSAEAARDLPANHLILAGSLSSPDDKLVGRYLAKAVAAGDLLDESSVTSTPRLDLRGRASLVAPVEPALVEAFNLDAGTSARLCEGADDRGPVFVQALSCSGEGEQRRCAAIVDAGSRRSLAALDGLRVAAQTCALAPGRGADALPAPGQ